MTAWLLSLEGTDAGRQVAMGLALMAAFLHALFGALQKGRHDPWLSRAAIDASYATMAAPFALLVVPWPEPHMWPIFAGAFVIHTAYKVAQAMTYSRGAYGVVYPVVRGTGPFFAVIGAGLIFGEHFTPGQWAGVAVLTTGIFGLAAYNLRTVTAERETMVPALLWAVVTGHLSPSTPPTTPTASARRPIPSPSSPGSSSSTALRCRSICGAAGGDCRRPRSCPC